MVLLLTLSNVSELKEVAEGKREREKGSEVERGVFETDRRQDRMKYFGGT